MYICSVPLNVGRGLPFTLPPSTRQVTESASAQLQYICILNYSIYLKLDTNTYSLTFTSTLQAIADHVLALLATEYYITGFSLLDPDLKYTCAYTLYINIQCILYRFPNILFKTRHNSQIIKQVAMGNEYLTQCHVKLYAREPITTCRVRVS